jgi:hypothetical protein
MVLWRCLRHGARSDVALKSGGVPAVLSGARISMSRLLEKPGPKRLFTRVRGRGILRTSH